MKKLLLAMLLMISPATALNAAPATTNLYEIEVVVFENRLSGLEGGELWKHRQEQTGGGKNEGATVADEQAAADSPLSAAVESLNKSGRHPVLAHLRWKQSAEAKSLSKPVQVSGAGGGLDGSLRFYLSRVLVVELNLALRDTQGGGAADSGLTTYELSESRRIKVSETHYFDHPKFGAVLRVTPVR